MKAKENIEQKEHRRVLNVIDASILLLLLLALLVTVYLVFFADTVDQLLSDGETVSVVCELELIDVDRALLRQDQKPPINSKDTFYHIDQDGSFVLGEIQTVAKALPQSVATSATDKDGNLIYAEHPTLKTVTVTVTATAEKNGDGYTVDGHALLIGDSFTAATPYFTATAILKNCREVTGNE